MITMFPNAPWLVWITPVISGLLVQPVARLGKRAVECFVVLVSLTTLGLALSMAADIYLNDTGAAEFAVKWISSLGFELEVFIDPLGVLFANLVAFFGALTLVYSLGYMAGEEGLVRYYSFMLLFIGSMIGLVTSGNFLQMFIFWEMVGVCSYSLVSFWYTRPESTRAGAKVFIMTRVGDVCLLAAIALLFTSLGSLSFPEVSAAAETLPLQTLTAIAFLALGGAVAKSAQMPLHTWLYGAMEAPTSVSALLHSATMVKAGIYLIARLHTLLGPLVSSIPMWLPSVAWIGATTALLGAASALCTVDIKGVLAYSTISQIGLMMAALGTAQSPSSAGWFASTFHATSHAFFEGLGFFAVGGIIHAVGTRDMRLIGGLRRSMPITFVYSLIVFLSCVGLPPFVGFFSKGMIMNELLANGHFLLALVIYASAAMTFAYNLRFMVLIFLRDSPGYLGVQPHEPPRVMLLSSGVLAVMCAVWGFLGPSVGRFMSVEVEMEGLSEALGAPSLVLYSVFLLIALVVYVYYYKAPAEIREGGTFLHRVRKVLESNYFLDDLYVGINDAVMTTSKRLRGFEIGFLERLPHLFARGIRTIADGLIRDFEVGLLERLPYIFANLGLSLARGVNNYFNALVDELLNIFASMALSATSTVKRVRANSLQHFVAATLVGIAIILISMALAR